MSADAPYCVRQTSAKSRQFLSRAAPSIFIFCHSAPQACMRWRDAAGKGCGPEAGVAAGG